MKALSTVRVFSRIHTGERTARAIAAADTLLIVLSFVHGAALILFPSFLLVALGTWWSSNTISHHFLHVPFFRSKAANRAYSLYLSILIGIPQSYWRLRHLAHHGGYTMTLRARPLLCAETAAILLLWSVLLTAAPDFFLYAYLPGYATGLALCYLHGYYEHARGTTSHYGRLYNALFFNDGYHIEHHHRPGEHWTQLPKTAAGENARSSSWPPILRWLEVFSIESLERLALRLKPLQRFLLRTHKRAFARLLTHLPPTRSVKIVGGGMYPRSALIVQHLLPEATITIIDASAGHLDLARKFLGGLVRFEHGYYTPNAGGHADLIFIPLSFRGDRLALYRDPPASALLVHDWIWRRRGKTVVVSWLLLKRMNLVLR